MNFFLLESLTVPELDEADYAEIARAAARLSAVDKRFAAFAAAVGVEHGRLPPGRAPAAASRDRRPGGPRLEADRSDLETMFTDFTEDAVPPEYRAAVTERWRELA